MNTTTAMQNFSAPLVAIHNNSVETLDKMTSEKQQQELLEKKIKELNLFITKATSDLRGPISSISGLLNLARQEITDIGSLSYLDMLAKSASRLEIIMMDLLQVIRVQHETVTLAPVNMEELLKDVLKSLAFIEGFNAIKFKTSVQQEKEFKTDRHLLVSILHKLIDNAIRYRRINTVTYVAISISESEEGIKIEVEDNGQGILKNIQNRVFDMFFRGNEHSSGTGLGLYIVKNAVEKLGGIINLESQENIGSKFTVLLP